VAALSVASRPSACPFCVFDLCVIGEPRKLVSSWWQLAGNFCFRTCTCVSHHTVCLPTHLPYCTGCLHYCVHNMLFKHAHVVDSGRAMSMMWCQCCRLRISLKSTPKTGQ